jgi:hypothetical protein
MGPPNSETFSYAVQIRDMLNQGGFGVPNSDTNLPENIHTDPTALVAIWEFGNVHEWPDLSFNTDQTNDFRLINFPLAMGNGFSFPYFSNTAGDTNEILSAIYFVFEKIGFRCTYACKPDWTSPNHYEIYVEEKPQ